MDIDKFIKLFEKRNLELQNHILDHEFINNENFLSVSTNLLSLFNKMDLTNECTEKLVNLIFEYLDTSIDIFFKEGISIGILLNGCYCDKDGFIISSKRIYKYKSRKKRIRKE